MGGQHERRSGLVFARIRSIIPSSVRLVVLDCSAAGVDQRET
jgi:hypothetical protein